MADSVATIAPMALPEHMQLCLALPVAAVVCVGPEHELHANDRFVALTGIVTMPVRPAREVFGEQWLVLEPLMREAPATATSVRFIFAGIEKRATIVTMRSNNAIVCMFIEDEQEQLAEEKTAEILARSEQPRARILVVEGNDESARMLKMLLEHRYEVALAHDGPVALSLAHSFPPDAVVTEIVLPVMDGYELARRLRAAMRPDLPFVAVTGARVEMRRSLEAGFAEHLVKPIDQATLERALDRVLHRSE